ncbi:AsnC family transcriptional regulator [Clostridiaceae bacterium 35-E11]
MDEIDKKIVELLQDNARISITDISKIINLSRPSVSERITRLIEKDILAKFTTSVPAHKIGHKVSFFLEISNLKVPCNKIADILLSNEYVCTSAFQEDYVSMGYNAALKAYDCVGLGRYVVATEIFNAIQAQDFHEGLKPSSAAGAVYDLIRKQVPFVAEDGVTYIDVEYIADLIKNKEIIKVVEDKIGSLAF